MLCPLNILVVAARQRLRSQPFIQAKTDRQTENSHGCPVPPPGRREGGPRDGGPVLAVAGPAAIAEQGAVHGQLPVVDEEEEMGGEGERRQHQQQCQSKGKACGEAGLVLSRRYGVAGVHVRVFPPDPA